MVSLERKRQWQAERERHNYPEVDIKEISSQELMIEGASFTLLEERGEALDVESLAARYSPVLESYDYILGDWSHEQLRLTGFYADEVPGVFFDKKINMLEDFLAEYCSFGCRYFLLARARTLEEIENRNQALEEESQEKRQKRRQNKKRQRKNRRLRKKFKPRELAGIVDTVPPANAKGKRRTITSGLKAHKDHFNIRRKK